MAGRPQVIRAVDLVCYINGRIFAVATGIDWEASYGTQARYGIDKQQPFEVMTTQASIRGTVECLRWHDTGGLEGQAIVPLETGKAELSRAKYFFLQLVDRATDTVVLQVPKAALVSQRWSVKARNILQGSFSFEGIGWSNEV